MDRPEISFFIDVLSKLTADSIKSLVSHWWRRLRRAPLQDPPAVDFKAAEELYRDHLVRWFEKLPLQRLIRTETLMEVPLEEVYTHPRAVVEAADSFTLEERRRLRELEQADEETRRDLWSHLDAARRERSSRIERKSVLPELYRVPGRAAVVLGDPGSGKTTLLHYLALTHARGPEVARERLGVEGAEAERLPIFVSLAAFEELLRERGDLGLSLQEFLPLFYARRREQPDLGPLFASALESGRALVLLDGLDEILDRTTRSYVAEQVRLLIGQWTPRGVRFVISSRFFGYREAPIPGVPAWTLLDFDDSEIEAFARRWELAWEKVIASSDTSSEGLPLAQAVLEDVRSHEGVRRLAANPLMLTLLALLRRRLGRLPERRAELFQRYVEMLFERWSEFRSPGLRERSAPQDRDSDREEGLLEPLALWLQSKDGGTASRSAMETRISEILLEEASLSRETASPPRIREVEKEAKRLLTSLCETRGLLVQRGPDTLAFLHLTFQEYFAGLALARSSHGERWSTIRPCLHEPRWREPILLCAGCLGLRERFQEVSDLVRAVLDSTDPTEPHLRRNLLLALAIAIDGVGLDARLTEELVTRAVGCLPTRVHALGKAILEALGRLVENGSARLEQCFAPALESTDAGMRRVAIEVLGNLRVPEATRGLLLAHLEDEDDRVVEAVLQALASRVGRDPEIRSLLLSRLDNPTAHVRWTAADALAGAVEDAGVRDALLAKLSDEDSLVKRSAATALASRIGKDVTVRERLVSLAADEDHWIRMEALRTLAAVAKQDADAREVLLRGLEDPEDWVRSAAIEGLADLADRDEQVRAAIVAALQDEGDEARFAAVSVLAPRAEVEESVRRRLEQRLEDEDDAVRDAALHALAGLLPTERLLEILERWRQEISWSLRSTAATVAGQSERRIPATALLRSVLDDARSPDADFALAAIFVPLSSRLADGQLVREKGLTFLRHSDPRVRLRAVLALSDRVRQDFEVKEALIASLHDEDYRVRRAAARALSHLLEEDPGIREILLQGLNNEGDYSLVGWLFRSPVSREATADEIRSAIDKLDRWISHEPSSLDKDIAQLRGDSARRIELLRLFEDKEKNLMRGLVARILAHFLDDGAIKAAVLTALRKEAFRVRLELVEELSGLPPASLCAEVEELLLGWLFADARPDYLGFHDVDEDWLETVRGRLANRLGERLPQNEALRSWLLEHLRDERWSARLGSALALLAWRGGPPAEIVSAVLDALGDRRGLESYPARIAAASFLIHDREHVAAAMELALAAARHGTRPWEFLPNAAWIRKQAARVLGSVQSSDLQEQAAEGLLQMMDQDEDPEVRDEAFMALAGLAAASEGPERSATASRGKLSLE